jgi:hypothetical protein
VAEAQQFVGPTDPFTDGDAAELLSGMMRSDPAIVAARHTYLAAYDDRLSAALKAGWDAYARAHEEYRAIPVEKDAIAVQDIVEARLRARLHS